MSETPLDLAAIRARADAATAGPWFGFHDDDGRVVSTFDAAICDVCAVDGVLDWGNGVNHANAEFIAHAREDIPALLGLVEYLLADGERVRAERDGFATEVKHLRAENAELWEQMTLARIDAHYSPLRLNAHQAPKTGPVAANRPWLARGDNHPANGPREGDAWETPQQDLTPFLTAMNQWAWALARAYRRPTADDAGEGQA